MATPLLVDLRDLGVNLKGVGRVLEGLAPRLIELDPDRYHVVCTRAALPLLPPMAPGRLHVLPRLPNSLWEQACLPGVAARIGAVAVYTHRECGPLWGRPTLLHLTEDPEVRWARQPADDLRDRSRRAYSRALMTRSVRRCHLGTSTAAVADRMAQDRRLERASISVIPLAVDHQRFHPVDHDGRLPYFFHLASGDPRDRTDLVIEAYARAVSTHESPPRLAIGGGLGAARAEIDRQVHRLGLEPLVELSGRLADSDLVDRYSSAVACIQPSSDEGFGLQPLEVMACGSLLIATPEESVREVAGEACVLWAEPSVEGLQQAMTAAWTSKSLGAEARVKNPARAASFTWERTAQIVDGLLRGIAVEPAVPS